MSSGTVPIDNIKKLREITGAGVMDCKKALLETGGNIENAVKILRERGISDAAKKSMRKTQEGIISAYVHTGNKLGVLLELNCETDFVARTEEFQDLAKQLCMQITASAPLYISRDDVPEEVLNLEREIYRKQAISSGKPEKVIDKIVAGKMEKFFSEVCLLEQPYIKDTNHTVGDIIKMAISKVGENITIGRFARFKLGEEFGEKKTTI